MKFVQTEQHECNLLNVSYFVKKIILNIKVIKVAYAKGKINENKKMTEKSDEKKRK